MKQQELIKKLEKELFNRDIEMLVKTIYEL